MGATPPETPTGQTGVGAVVPERYQVGEFIGGRYEVFAIHRGKTGVVYGTLDYEGRKTCALRTLQERLAGDERARDLFASKVAMWIRLGRYPFIVDAHWVHLFDGRPYAVTHYIYPRFDKGNDLTSWIGSKDLTVLVATRLALQIAMGMRHAVLKVPGLVHHHLEPANVLVNEIGQGIVKNLGLASPSPGSGTPPYMAPEQWRGDVLDCRTDIYAYGCILYEMFTGHSPFAAQIDDLGLAHLTTQPRPPRSLNAELPADLERLALCCLEKSPNSRPSSWGEIVEECTRCFQRLSGQIVRNFEVRKPNAAELRDAGYSLAQLKRHAEALEFYDRALVLDPAAPGVRWLVSGSLHNMALALNETGRVDEALRALEQLLTRFTDDDEPVIREHIASALYCKGVLLGQKLARRDEAIRVYDQLLARFGDATEVTILRHIAMALGNKASEVHRLGRPHESIRIKDEMLARFVDATDPAVRDLVARVFIGKGFALRELDRHEERLRTYDEMLARFADASEPGIRKQLASALISKGATLARLGRNEECLHSYDEVLARFAGESTLREQLAIALGNKSGCLFRLDRNEDGVRACEELLERFGAATEPPIHEQIAKVLGSKGALLAVEGRARDAVRVFDEVIARFADSTHAGVLEQVARATDLKARTLPRVD